MHYFSGEDFLLEDECSSDDEESFEVVKREIVPYPTEVGVDEVVNPFGKKKKKRKRKKLETGLLREILKFK